MTTLVLERLPLRPTQAATKCLLPDGEHLLGRSKASLVPLFGVNFAPEHAKLIVSKGKVTVQGLTPKEWQTRVVYESKPGAGWRNMVSLKEGEKRLLGEADEIKLGRKGADCARFRILRMSAAEAAQAVAEADADLAKRKADEEEGKQQRAEERARQRKEKEAARKQKEEEAAKRKSEGTKRKKAAKSAGEGEEEKGAAKAKKKKKVVEADSPCVCCVQMEADMFCSHCGEELPFRSIALTPTSEHLWDGDNYCPGCFHDVFPNVRAAQLQGLHTLSDSHRTRLSRLLG